MSSTESIYVIPQGGIGNQLFQLAAGLAIQKTLGGVLYILPTRLNKHSGRDYRTTLYSRGNPIEFIPGNYAMYRQGDGFEPWNNSIIQGNRAVALDGYFQYLPAIRDVIPDIKSDLLAALDSRITAVKEKYAICDTENTVFVHVRRGDYVPLAHLFGGVGENYYTNAVKEYMSENLFGKRFLLISDDPEWCKQQPWLKSYQTIDELDELDSLAIMASCKGGAIIANSTFSWWGAILSGTPRVFYPSKWYSDKKPDLFPQGWVCVEV